MTSINAMVKPNSKIFQAAAAKAKTMPNKAVGSPVVPCPLMVAKSVTTEKGYWQNLVCSQLVQDSIIDPVLKSLGIGDLQKMVVGTLVQHLAFDPLLKRFGTQLLKPSSVKGAANLIKMAGKGAKPILKKISPDLARVIGKATNKGTTNAVGRSLRAFFKTTRGKVVGSGVADPIFKFAERAVQGKPLFTKPALFEYASSIAKGAISGAISGAIAGSICPGPGTVVGFATGVVIGVATSFAVDVVAKPFEDSLKKKMGLEGD